MQRLIESCQLFIVCCAKDKSRAAKPAKSRLLIISTVSCSRLSTLLRLPWITPSCLSNRTPQDTTYLQFVMQFGFRLRCNETTSWILSFQRLLMVGMIRNQSFYAISALAAANICPMAGKLDIAIFSLIHHVRWTPFFPKQCGHSERFLRSGSRPSV